MRIDLDRLKVGDLIASAEGAPLDAEALVKYAQASGDLNPLHTDRAFAAKAGFPGLVVHGMLNMARLGQLLTRSVPAERILAFSVRFEGVLLAGQATMLRMSVAGRSDEEIECELLMTSANDQRIASGRARVSIFSDRDRN